MVLNSTGRNRFTPAGRVQSDSGWSWTFRIARVTLHDGQVAPLTSQKLARAIFAVCLTVFPSEIRPLALTIDYYERILYQIRVHDFAVQFSFNNWLSLLNFSLFLCSGFCYLNWSQERSQHVLLWWWKRCNLDASNQKRMGPAADHLLRRACPIQQVSQAECVSQQQSTAPAMTIQEVFSKSVERIAGQRVWKTNSWIINLGESTTTKGWRPLQDAITRSASILLKRGNKSPIS